MLSKCRGRELHRKLTRPEPNSPHPATPFRLVCSPAAAVAPPIGLSSLFHIVPFPFLVSAQGFSRYRGGDYFDAGVSAATRTLLVLEVANLSDDTAFSLFNCLAGGITRRLLHLGPGA